MFRMQSSSHLDSLASNLLLSPSQADITFVTNSTTLSAHRALLLPILPSLSSLLCFACSPHDPLLLLLPDASSSALSSALGTLYTTRKPDELAELLGLSVKQEESIPTTSSFPEDAWVGEQTNVKEGDILETNLDSENTEGPCDIETLGGDEEEVDSTKGSELENKKSDDHESKNIIFFDLNEIESSGFFESSLADESIDGKESKDERELTIEKRKAEGALLNHTEKKMFKGRRCDEYKVKKTPKEYRTEAEVDDQFRIESESDGLSGEKESESIVKSEETRKRGGKPLDWQHVESFDSPQAFNRSQIKAELDKVMKRNRSTRTSEARQEYFVCKFSRKHAWKSCLRQYRVMYLNTSYEIVVLSTSAEHHHEEDLGFTTKENYHWTVQQEKTLAQSLVTHMKNTVILEELRWLNLVNGSGNLPTLWQIGSKKRYMKIKQVRETREKPAGGAVGGLPTAK